MKSPTGPSILGCPPGTVIVIPRALSVKIARVPSPSSRVMDAPDETVQSSAATMIASGGLLLSVSTPFAAVPGGMPPLSCAPAGSAKRIRTVHNRARTAPDKENTRRIPTLLRYITNERYCALLHNTAPPPFLKPDT